MKKFIVLIALSLAFVGQVFAQTATVPSVNSLDNRAQSYRAAIIDISTAASATDIFRITGSASKTIYIKRISVSGTQTTAGNIAVSLYKRSTANSDGTTTAITEHPMDSGFGAATAVSTGITANQTVGTGVVIGARRMAWLTTGTAVDSQPATWVFGDWGPNSFVVLRGVAQALTVNLNATTITGGKATVEVEWMEK